MATHPNRGVALAGGGPLGAIYEIGALLALGEALRGLDLTGCGVYVGVSSGAFIAAGLANGLSPKSMHRMFIESDAADDPFEPDLLLRPALGEYANRLASLPQLAWPSPRASISSPAVRQVSSSPRAGSRKRFRPASSTMSGSATISRSCCRDRSEPTTFASSGTSCFWWRRTSTPAPRFRLAPRLGRRADRARRPGERGVARVVPAGRDRRPLLCRRRIDEDAACIGGAARRGEAADVHQSARAVRRPAGGRARAPKRSAPSSTAVCLRSCRRRFAP